MENECRHLTTSFSTPGQDSEGHDSLLESWQAWIEERAACASKMRKEGRKEGYNGRVVGLVCPCCSRAGTKGVFAPVRAAGSLPVRA
jgi:hypothetical protein